MLSRNERVSSSCAQTSYIGVQWWQTSEYCHDGGCVGFNWNKGALSLRLEGLRIGEGAYGIVQICDTKQANEDDPGETVDFTLPEYQEMVWTIDKLRDTDLDSDPAYWVPVLEPYFTFRSDGWFDFGNPDQCGYEPSFNAEGKISLDFDKPVPRFLTLCFDTKEVVAYVRGVLDSKADRNLRLPPKTEQTLAGRAALFTA